MARDYRYGHKPNKVSTRRTQQATSDSTQPATDSPNKLPTSRVRDPVKVESSNPIESTPKPRLPRLRGKRPTLEPTEAVKPAVQTTDTSSDSDLQKIKNKVTRGSLPRHVRKELEAQEALEKAQAEQAEVERINKQQVQQEKRHHLRRLTWWLSLSIMTLLGLFWLLYAPFFLAFAFEMGWVSEETRSKLDPAAGVRSELVSKSIESAKKPNPVAPSEPPADAFSYGFYRDLPKAVVLTGVQPIAVKTKAPVYLQLLSVSNEVQAQEERKRLSKSGHQVQVSVTTAKSGARHYVLKMGPYDDQRAINRLKVELQKLGIDAQEVAVTTVPKSAETSKQPIVPVAESRSTTSAKTRGAVTSRD